MPLALQLDRLVDSLSAPTIVPTNQAQDACLLPEVIALLNRHDITAPHLTVKRQVMGGRSVVLSDAKAQLQLTFDTADRLVLMTVGAQSGLLAQHYCAQLTPAMPFAQLTKWHCLHTFGVGHAVQSIGSVLLVKNASLGFEFGTQPTLQRLIIVEPSAMRYWLSLLFADQSIML